MTRLVDLTEETTPAADDLLLLAKASDGEWFSVKWSTVDGGGGGTFVEVGGPEHINVGVTTTGDFDGLTSRSEITSISSTANAPATNGWYTLYQARHRNGESDGVDYASQIAIGMTTATGRAFFRGQSISWTNWFEFWHDGNLNPNQVADRRTATSGNLQTSDVGGYVYVGGDLTIPNSTFANGDVVTLVNNSGTDRTITASITDCYVGGADVSSFTLSGRGLATILFTSSTECYVSGAVA